MTGAPDDDPTDGGLAAPTRRELLAGAGSAGLGAALAPSTLAGTGGAADCGRPTPSKVRAETRGGGNYFVDGHGRAVTLHGVNVVYKRDPYYPPERVFDESDVRKIADWGFNFVRLGYQWAGVEPERGEFDADYLDRMERLVGQFREYGIYVLVDMHQDLYSPVFGGDGAPGWAVYHDGALEDYEYDDVDDWFSNYTDPAVQNALDHFWNNDHGLLDRYAAAWREVARRVGGMENVVGYDLINEPMPGGDNRYTLELEDLPDAYGKIAGEIRRVDRETPVWVEPTAMLFNGGIPTGLGRDFWLFSTDVDDPADNVAFSFHNYAERFDGVAKEVADWIPYAPDDLRTLDNAAVMENAENAMGRMGAPAVMTEFCTGDSLEIERMVRMAERKHMGWAFWPYDESAEGWTSPAEYPPHHMGVDTGHGRGMLDILVRPYPQAVAGVPRTVEFDRESGRFHLRYRPTGASADTVVFVPDRHYDGYDVAVEGASVTCRRGQYVHVGDHSGGTVDVEVRPTGGGAGTASATCRATETTRERGSVSAGGEAAYTYAARTSRPCGLAVDLAGEGDLDLYLTLDGRRPSPNDFDRRSWSPGSAERVTVDGSDLQSGTRVGLLVRAYAGGGDYALTITERGDLPVRE